MDDVRKNLYYTEHHIWVSVEDNSARYGITDYAQKELGELVYVDLPGVGDKFSAGEEMGGMESLKSVGPLYCPVSGKITAVNKEIDVQPVIMNESPYEEGWIAVIEMSDPSEISKLMDAEAYGEFLSKL